jgi:DNA (cytosine-5)-methyltransferase 1
MAGGKVLLANEFVEEARKTYSANWGKTKVLPDDVRKITGKQILDEIGFKPLELDIFDGSPPCSAFSTSGKRDKGWGDKVKKYSDVAQSNVEDLFFEYIRILDELKPKCFIAENVAGLTVGTAKGYLNEILRLLRACHYHVEARVLDAKWLGVPQTRNRLIIVGIHESLYKPEMQGKLHPKPIDKIVTLGEAFEGLCFTEADRVGTDISKYAACKFLKTVKPGASHEKWFNLCKGSKSSVSQCITANCANISSATGARHWDNRAYTVAEIKRIMSIPDDYILTGDYSKQVERLGRMVPPLMMKAVAENLYKLVLSR